jgi:hypothetical protein
MIASISLLGDRHDYLNYYNLQCLTKEARYKSTSRIHSSMSMKITTKGEEKKRPTTTRRTTLTTSKTLRKNTKTWI